MGGTLDIAIMKDSFGKWNPAVGDHHSGLTTDIVEWKHLFFECLNAPEWEPYLDGEDIHSYEDRQRKRFSKAITEKGFPLLGRIDRIFRDTAFAPGEIRGLAMECEAAKAELPESTFAILHKILTACHEAEESGSGLIFLSD